jgi:ATP-binding cassette subfamily B (MDR/TAP) protein 1
VLIAKPTYSYLQMVKVLNLVVFSVTLGSQMLDFSASSRISCSIPCFLTWVHPRSKKSEIPASHLNFHASYASPHHTEERRGMLRPEISGPITFSDVSLAYPERPDVQVLKNASFEIDDGECVAIVGASSLWKSTVAPLLQRLYEPRPGKIYVGADSVQAISASHLRRTSLSSAKTPHSSTLLWRRTSHGNNGLLAEGVEAAARPANVHDFIMTLPKGYEAMSGEKASLISGEQAQRLQIACALARPCKVLILDEYISALDPANQAAIMETMQKVKFGRTTMVITHKIQMMQMFGRILVVQDGGNYGEWTTQRAHGSKWHLCDSRERRRVD